MARDVSQRLDAVDRRRPYWPDEPCLKLRLHELQDASPGDALGQLVSAGFDRIPMPGSGHTLQRWRLLAAVAAHDLSLAKLFEGHTDALAIMAELGADEVPSGSTWAVWAAEPPQARVWLTRGQERRVRLSGRKAWCSGAASVSHALMTCWERSGEHAHGPWLVAVPLDQAGVHVTDKGWRAVGMAAAASVEVEFDGATGTVIGGAGDYLSRPGFWHGGAGIAACWYGAAAALAEPLRRRVVASDEPHAAAHLGAVDVLLQQAAALLREAALAMDRSPRIDDSQLLAMRVRASVESAATAVLDHVGRALGAGPFCLDAEFARRAADLPVFLRQSHAERDLQALGQQVAGDGTEPLSSPSPWRL